MVDIGHRHSEFSMKYLLPSASSIEVSIAILSAFLAFSSSFQPSAASARGDWGLLGTGDWGLGRRDFSVKVSLRYRHIDLPVNVVHLQKLQLHQHSNANAK
jgi:hypothetical protein